ncbi:MAG: hypothetical protein Q8M02_14670 [Candidatus Didemnitutus sp.]|nr:hypothetical protein [Candidatus Didemnitutus sp.]
MRTKREPKHKPNANRELWVPPRGIRYFDRTGRPNPFYLQWRDSAGNTKTLAYRLEADRERAAKALAEKRDEHGRSIMEFDPAGWREYREAKAAAEGADLRVVVHEWRRATKEEGTDAHTLSVPAAVKKYLTLRLSEDLRKGTDTWRHIELHLSRRFAAAFAGRKMHEVTKDDLRGWMNGLMNPDAPGEAMSGTTKRHHRRDVNTFFKRAQAEGWAKTNPCALVKPPRHSNEESSGVATKKRVLTVEQLAELFRVNVDFPIVGRLALELFGGMRASSAERALKEHINFAERGIEMTQHKSGKRKYRTGHPENLWAWLEHAGDAAWSKVSEGNYGKLKSDAFMRAGFPNPGNTLRHSFVSYHLASFKNPPLTQHLAQHRHSATTEGYEGFATAADAAKWLQILPPKSRAR